MIEVTRKLLDSYRKTKREIPVLEAEIEEMQRGNIDLGHSTVLDYRSGHARPSNVAGFNWALFDKRRETLARKREETNAVEKWIEDIEDGQTRCVFRMYYLEGMSWEKIAAKIGAFKSGESYPRRCIRDVYLIKMDIQ